MNISKLRALWSLVTGGWSGLAVYVLEAVNKWLASLDQSKIAQCALVAKSVANAIEALSPLLPSKYDAAVKATTSAVSTLAAALSDGNVTQEELGSNVCSIESAIKAWKKAV